MEFLKEKAKLKLRTLVNSVAATRNFLALDFPLSDAWEIKKFFMKLNPELEVYEELRKKTIIKYGMPIPGTQDYQVKAEHIMQYQKEIEELLDKEVEMEIIKIKMEDLLELEKKLGKEFKISVTDLIQLDWFIV